MNTYQRQSVVNYGRQVNATESITLSNFSACFSHGETNYLVTADITVPNAVDGWVLIELGRDTGKPVCTVEDVAIEYANILPTSSTDGHLLFNIPDNICYRWFNGEWVETVAMNIGRMQDGKFDKQAIGSQIGTVENVTAYPIYFDRENQPLVFRNSSRFRFATVDDNGDIKLENGLMHFSFSGSVDFGICDETIPEFTPVCFSNSGGIARYNGTRSPIGLSIKSCQAGDKIVFIASGYAYSKNWNFSWPGYNVVAYDNGALGQGVDLNQPYFQACGKAINSQSLFIDFHQRIKVIENEDV